MSCKPTPGMKPYLKGFHLLLETYVVGWKRQGGLEVLGVRHTSIGKDEAPVAMSGVNLSLLTQAMAGSNTFALAPLGRFTLPVLRFKEYLKKHCCFLLRGNSPSNIASGAFVPSQPTMGLAMTPPWDVNQPSNNPECVVALACRQETRREEVPTTGSCKTWWRPSRRRQPFS